MPMLTPRPPSLNVKRGKVVEFKTSKRPRGSIIINSKTNELFYVLGLRQGREVPGCDGTQGLRMEGHTQGFVQDPVARLAPPG